MAYTYSSALITTFKASVDPYFTLFNNVILAKQMKNAMHLLIAEICTEFSAITSEA